MAFFYLLYFISPILGRLFSLNLILAILIYLLFRFFVG